MLNMQIAKYSLALCLQRLVSLVEICFTLMQISTDLNTCNVLYSMKENWPFVFPCYVFSMTGPSLTLECIYSGNNRSISLWIHHVNAMNTLTQNCPCFGLCWEGLCINETHNSNLCTHPYMSLHWPSLFGHFALLYIAMRSFYMLLDKRSHDKPISNLL
jgi:hypothetical protein